MNKANKEKTDAYDQGVFDAALVLTRLDGLSANAIELLSQMGYKEDYFRERGFNQDEVAEIFNRGDNE